MKVAWSNDPSTNMRRHVVLPHAFTSFEIRLSKPDNHLQQFATLTPFAGWKQRQLLTSKLSMLPLGAQKEHIHSMVLCKLASSAGADPCDGAAGVCFLRRSLGR